MPRGSLYAIMGFMGVSGNPTSSSAAMGVKYEVHDDCALVLLGWGTRKPSVILSEACLKGRKSLISEKSCISVNPKGPST